MSEMINDNMTDSAGKLMKTLVVTSMALNIIFVAANLYTMHRKRVAGKSCNCQEK